MQVFDVVRKVRDRYVNTSHPPTATAVAVVQLAQKDYLIEVEAVAIVSRGRSGGVGPPERGACIAPRFDFSRPTAPGHCAPGRASRARRRTPRTTACCCAA